MTGYGLDGRGKSFSLFRIVEDPFGTYQASYAKGGVKATGA
jgi:hypothetical protein